MTGEMKDALAARIKVRIDAMIERDGSEEAAITGRGIGISYLFAKEIYRALSTDKAVGELREALEAARRAIGDHNAPHDCYATGPLTGDAYRDLVQCPACSFINMYAALTASRASKSQGGRNE